jgi:hypothetical protein
MQTALLQNPQPVWVLLVQPVNLPRLSLLPGKLRVVTNCAVTFFTQHRDVALENRPVTHNGDLVHAWQVVIDGVPKDDTITFGDDHQPPPISRSVRT